MVGYIYKNLVISMLSEDKIVLLFSLPILPFERNRWYERLSDFDFKSIYIM